MNVIRESRVVTIQVSGGKTRQSYGAFLTDFKLNFKSVKLCGLVVVVCECGKLRSARN